MALMRKILVGAGSLPVRIKRVISNYRYWRKRSKVLVGLTILLMVFLIIPGLITIFSLPTLKAKAFRAESQGRLAYEAMAAKDVSTAKSQLSLTHQSLAELDQTYTWLSWWKITPLRFYYQDGERLILAAKTAASSGVELLGALEPHQNLLGFSEAGSELVPEDRIMSLILLMAEIQPALKSLDQDLSLIDSKIQKINPNRYPITVQGKYLPGEIRSAQEKLALVAGQLNDSLPFIESLPKLAGTLKPLTYLMVFQNDGEIRPTGGFMTAYSAIRMEQGVVKPLKSDDIYKLDEKFAEFIPAPEPIEKYLPLVQQWHLRDMNLSPDFKESMETFLPYYDSLPEEEPVEAVLAIDTEFLTGLLRILGPVAVTGYGTFSADTEPRCDCPQVVYELENIATRPTPYIREDRKAVLGLLMEALIDNLYQAPGEAWPDLIELFSRQLLEKHIQFYFRDEGLQQAVERANFAGRIRQFDGDYLHVNNANFAGAKSNFFISDEIEQTVERLNGNTLKKTVTLIYKNPYKSDNCNFGAGQLCLNSIYRSFIRVYAPKGSRLIEAYGFAEDTVKSGEEFGLSRFEGFYTLAPQSQVKLTLVYELPYSDKKDYRLLVQKQAGTKTIKHTLTLGQESREDFLSGDRVFEPVNFK